MKYLVKETYTALRSNSRYEKGYKEVWYNGKSRSYKELCDYIKDDAWARKHFAEKYIQNDKDFDTRIGQDFWNIEYEIIEIEG